MNARSWHEIGGPPCDDCDKAAVLRVGGRLLCSRHAARHRPELLEPAVRRARGRVKTLSVGSSHGKHEES